MMQFSILQLFQGWGGTEWVVTGATVSAALVGLYYIYRERGTVFFNWREAHKAFTAAVFFKILAGAFLGSIIPGFWHMIPHGGIDLATAVFIALISPPLMLTAGEKIFPRAKESTKLQALKQKTYDPTLGRVRRRYQGYQEARAPSPTPDLHSHPPTTQVLIYDGQRAKLHSHLVALSEAGMIPAPLIEDIMDYVPSAPDLPRIQAEHAKVTKEKAVLERMNAYQLKEELVKVYGQLKVAMENNQKLQEDLEQERNPLRRGILAGAGVLAGYLGRNIIIFLLTGVWGW